jgi:alpha-L-fucosidase 2
MKTTITIFLLTFVIYNLAPSQDLKLWYDRPAQFFEETLLLGNGTMGASVFGGVRSDKIYLNDATLWSGEPVSADTNTEVYKNIPAIREALKNNDYKLAGTLNKKIQGKYSESFAPLGTMLIDIPHHDTARNYVRELNLADAVSKVSYQVNGVTFTREYFISNPDKVMIVKLTSSKKGALTFQLRFESLLRYHRSTNGNVMKAKGYAPYHAEPSYRGDRPNAILFDENRGIRFTSLFQIKNTGGKIVTTDTTLGVKDANEAIIYITEATSFNGFDKNPATDGADDLAMATDKMSKAFSRSYQEIKNAHIADYQTYFNRVSLNLGATDVPNLPTNDRLKRYAEGKDDKNLEVLYFQFGRYLLISSSRTRAVPANLQGVWNPYIRPPWSSNYTTNINAEENYWLAENTNLTEMHHSLLDFIANTSVTGRVTAKNFYGVGGWAVGHNSDIWAMSNPVGEGKGDPSWASWNMGGAWLSTHLWEHYQFTRDEDFIRTKGYPIMKGAAQFCLEWLVEDDKGNLITSPSTSPENIFRTPEGFKGSTLYGGTADLAMIRECFEQTIAAAKVLKAEDEFTARLQQALVRLHPYQVGASGNLQEWYFDWKDSDPHHRHQSHLFGLFPGHHITPALTPELANACRRTLEIKGDETTGWSKGWIINLWARLLDGNHAYKMYRELLKYVDPDDYKGADKKTGGGTYPNLMDAHAPFQIDGNFGGAAAVVEMLLQSTDKEISLLPAIPDAWPDGSVKGICARGAFEISMNWENKTPKTVTITSKAGGATVLRCGDKHRDVSLQKGETITLQW